MTHHFQNKYGMGYFARAQPNHQLKHLHKIAVVSVHHLNSWKGVTISHGVTLRKDIAMIHFGNVDLSELWDFHLW